MVYTKLPPSHLFRRNSENLVAVRKGLTQAERWHKEAIRHGDPVAVDFAARIHTFMVGLTAECRLRKALTDTNGFNDREREIIRTGSQLDQWKKAVEYAFRRHYSIPIHLKIEDAGISQDAVTQYRDLSDMLSIDLAAVIDDRNKTAHGQWEWHLNSKETAVTGKALTPLNYIQIRERSKIIGHIAELVHILAVSEPTFRRDYQAAHAEILKSKANLDGASYPEFVTSIRSRRRSREGQPSNAALDGNRL